MNLKLRAIVSFFAVCVLSSSVLAMEGKEEERRDLSIAVFGGGGTNTFASLRLAVKFAELVGKPMNKIFNQTWGTSGGAISAALLMNKEKASELFLSSVGKAFPDLSSFFSDLKDADGCRREAIETELEHQFKDLKFGKENNNVVIASADGKPVYYCGSKMALDKDALRCKEETTYVEAIVNSSCFNMQREVTVPLLGIIMTMKVEVSLFRNKESELNPDGVKKIVCDGAHCAQGLDGFTPTPLVIDYLKNIPGHHKVVVFDNGGPANEAFRKSINLDDGVARLTFGETKIDLYIISVIVENFDVRAAYKTKEHFDYLEKQVENAISDHSAFTFAMAISVFTQQQ
jgi:hypothetical protein